MSDKSETGNSLPNTASELWENWQQPDGAGPCSHCSRHWSRRSDIPDQNRSDQPNCYGMHPWFAEGKFNPDIVIMGEEPGYHDPDPDGNRIGKPFEQSRKDIREVANEDSGTLKQVRPLFEVLYDNDIATYWTEMTKCNPIGNNDNLDGQDECCGLSEDVERSYLRDELEELEPEIVVTLGKPASKNLLELYNHKLSDFADSTMSGEPLSGFHTRSNHTARFEIATAFHPTYLFDNSEFQSRKSDIKTQQNQNGVKKPYYGQYGDDLLRWFKKATQS